MARRKNQSFFKADKHFLISFEYLSLVRLIRSFSWFQLSEMKLLVISLSVLLVVLSGQAEKARYDNYRVYEIFVENEDQLELMKQIENYPDGVSGNDVQV